MHTKLRGVLKIGVVLGKADEHAQSRFCFSLSTKPFLLVLIGEPNKEIKLGAPLLREHVENELSCVRLPTVVCDKFSDLLLL